MRVSHFVPRHPEAAESEGPASSGQRRQTTRCLLPSSGPPMMHHGGTGQSRAAQRTNQLLTQRANSQSQLIFMIISFFHFKLHEAAVYL